MIEQHDDFEGWRKKREYCMKWMVGAVFSEIKRTFCERVLAKSIQKVNYKGMTKVNLYCLFIP